MNQDTVKSTPKSTFWLTRFVILRLLGFVYFFAFLSLVIQLKSLIGSDGLTPATIYLDANIKLYGSLWNTFIQLPTLFLFWNGDHFLIFMAWIGVIFSILLLAGIANKILLILMWLLYMSFVNIGQTWYGYGWEIQLLETTFLAIFLVPAIDWRPFPKMTPPIQVIWLFRWLIFRVMLGAGLIKLRGDPCWLNLTCLAYHYETQPLPNPISPYLHFMPLWFHKLGVLYNHLVEIISPWFMLIPGWSRIIAGCLMLGLQVLLIISGNLSFLNWVTLIPIMSCFDDRFFAHLLPRFLVDAAKEASSRSSIKKYDQILAWTLVVVIGFFSINPVMNLLSSTQKMNASFDRLNIVNTYGAFGYVGKERLQVIFEGTSADVLNDKTEWKPYEYKCQPGDIYRRPCFIAPFQYRLDWQIWFAAMSKPSQYPWVYHLAWKLLHNNQNTLDLFANNPFPKNPPKYIRARLYLYRFAPLSNPEGKWWERTEVGIWLPPLSVENKGLQKLMKDHNWS